MRALQNLARQFRVLTAARENRLDLPRWLLHRPILALGVGAAEAAAAFSNRMDYRLKLLAESMVASIVGCEFCLDIGAALAKDAGVSERQLLELHAFETSDAFNDDERLILRFATALTVQPVQVDADLRDRLVQRFGKAAVVELAAAVAHEHERTRLYLGLGIRPGRFAPDGACRVPLAPPHLPQTTDTEVDLREVAKHQVADPAVAP